MRRAARLLAPALAVAAIPAALAGAEPATGGAASPTGAATPTARAHAGQPSPTPATARAMASAASAAKAALASVRKAPPATVVRVRPGRTLALRARPDGAVAVKLGDTTEFGSRQALGVVGRRGRWLGVTTPELPNGRLGWIDARSGSIALSRSRWSIHADVSHRRIVLKRDGLPVRRLSVAVGRPGSPTPTGRFAVTDKLSGSRFEPYYGCCILAISATQPNTPPGWTGGDRMAIHGTSDPSSIGAAASAGCLRAADGDLRLLMDRVPLGTPVVIRL